MSAKSNPGDGQHGKGVKGNGGNADYRRPLKVLSDLVKGLLDLRRR
jgi:hypothetical protein